MKNPCPGTNPSFWTWVYRPHAPHPRTRTSAHSSLQWTLTYDEVLQNRDSKPSSLALLLCTTVEILGKKLQLYGLSSCLFVAVFQHWMKLSSMISGVWFINFYIILHFYLLLCLQSCLWFDFICLEQLQL